jgi:hypothetical protein
MFKIKCYNDYDNFQNKEWNLIIYFKKDCIYNATIVDDILLKVLDKNNKEHKFLFDDKVTNPFYGIYSDYRLYFEDILISNRKEKIKKIKNDIQTRR